MAGVEYAPRVVVILGREAGLLAAVGQALRSVLEAAVQLRRVPSGTWSFKARPDECLHICVGGYFVTYALDLRRGVVAVLDAVPMQEKLDVGTAG